MQEPIKFNYRSYLKRDPKTGKFVEVHFPFISVILIYKHKVGGAIEALVDSGSEMNVFPADYAIFFFSLKEKQLKKGEKRAIRGIGGVEIEAFKHLVTLHTLHFRFKTPVWFSYQQQVPLLGRKGFFDHFRSINFYERDKVLEIVP